jgi:hypothetical protein
MQRQEVESTVIGTVGYTRMLEIQFASGRVYQYYDVPQEIFEGMLNAESKGKYFNASIRGQFRYQEIELKGHHEGRSKAAQSR